MADRGHSERPSWLESVSINESNSSHIDVRRAEEEFNTLSRQLSNRLANSIRNTTDSTTTAHDPEKGLDVDEEERFDLREYLTSSNDANQKAGIRHKVKSESQSLGHVLIACFQNVGVVWENLQVEVAGGLDSKVATFPIR